VSYVVNHANDRGCGSAVGCGAVQLTSTILNELRELAAKKPRKKVLRLYREEGLAVSRARERGWAPPCSSASRGAHDFGYRSGSGILNSEDE
jgi:hypothetical protein